MKVLLAQHVVLYLSDDRPSMIGNERMYGPLIGVQVHTDQGIVSVLYDTMCKDVMVIPRGSDLEMLVEISRLIPEGNFRIEYESLLRQYQSTIS